ncbi:MAG: ABC transporter permease [Planctomycetes bacterium]|nr:ABC transporter permease [Planctomycetota bacterium]
MTTTEHYSAETANTSLLHYAARTPEYARTLRERRSLLWNFVHRDLLGRFKGSLFGVFWVLIQPIFLFVVYFAIFGILFAPRLEEGPDKLFALYMFSGILIFTAIQEATNASLTSIVNNANLVKKVKFPCELMPLVPAIVAAAVLVVGCLVLVVAGLLIGGLVFDARLLYFPVLIVAFVGMTGGMGLLLAGANVFVRDIAHLYRIFTSAWFFLSPIFWRLDQVESKFSEIGMGWLSYALMLNPAFPIVMAQRQVFGIGDSLPPAEYAADFPWSLTTNVLVSLAWAVFFLVVGYGFFKSRRHKFADLV